MFRITNAFFPLSPGPEKCAAFFGWFHGKGSGGTAGGVWVVPFAGEGVPSGTGRGSGGRRPIWNYPVTLRVPPLLRKKGTPAGLQRGGSPPLEESGEAGRWLEGSLLFRIL